MQFLIKINHHILECQRAGGVLLQVGSHDGAQTYTFFPHICLYVGDNQGSSQTACIKQGRTYKPCRICEADRHEIHNCNVECALRNAGYVHALQTAGEKAFGDKVRYLEGAMLECVRYLEKLLPVPKKDTLDQYRENYSSGHAIENIMNSHSQIEDAGDEEEDEENSEEDEEDEFNFHCDEGLESADVEVMTRIE